VNLLIRLTFRIGTSVFSMSQAVYSRLTNDPFEANSVQNFNPANIFGTSLETSLRVHALSEVGLPV
jgi:hypothetical protein